MNTRRLVCLCIAVGLSLCAGTVSADDKFALAAPNGLTFGEIKGYETWPFLAPSQRTDKSELRVILGNAVAVNAMKSGVPENGKPFPEGSIIVKVGYSQRANPAFPAAFEPDTLQRVEYIIKDSKRFPKSDGWGYARFVHDAKTGTYSAFGKDPSFQNECHQCHTLVKARDFIFTRYPAR